MDLEDFTAETLVSVLRGVSKACALHAENHVGGFIAPFNADTMFDYDKLRIIPVDFDVSVTVESLGSVNGKVGFSKIKVLEFGVGGDASRKQVGESRVKFSIPVTLPGTKIGPD